jgi:hypothetical protein
MLHASVSYAAGLIFVAYEPDVLPRTKINQTIRSFGVRLLETPAEAKEKAAHDHDHGSAPVFLPHWLQERWTLLLIAAGGLFF